MKQTNTDRGNNTVFKKNETLALVVHSNKTIKRISTMCLLFTCIELNFAIL